MSQSSDSGMLSHEAGGAIGPYLRVKISAGKLAVAGLGTTNEPVELGSTTNREAFASGDIISIASRNKQGSVELTAAGVIAAGAAVYGAASGKVSTTASGNAIGVAKTAAGADGDVIEVIRY